MLTKWSVTAIATITMGCANLHAAEGWLTDFQAAQHAARKLKLPMFIVFTTSEGSPPCDKAMADIFTRKNFIDEASKTFVLCLITISPQIQLSREKSEQLSRLINKYNIKAVPDVIIANPDGRQIGRIRNVSTRTVPDVLKCAAAMWAINANGEDPVEN